MNLLEVTKKFPTEDKCLEYLSNMRWSDGVVRCLICGNDKVSTITRRSVTKNKRAQVYACLEPTCRQQFSVTTGSIFHDSHLPLQKWFMAIALMLNAKKGLSAKQLERDLGVNYRTAWHLSHRIRKAMQADGTLKLLGTVEIDEVYLGGKRNLKNRWTNKDCVLGMRQRGGPLQLVRVEDTKQGTLYDAIAKYVDRGVERIITDENPAYNFRVTYLEKVKHDRIKHSSGIYVRGDIHTNTIESAFSLLRRAIAGNYHHLSLKHLQRYLDEFSYRYNRRESVGVFEQTLQRMMKTAALPYATLTSASPEPS